MKKPGLLLISLIFITYSVFSQKSGPKLDIAGFKFEKRLKGPKHKNSKIIELMVDQNDYYLAVAYKGPKSYLTLIVYELYSWKIAGTFKFKSRAELYNSYFSEDGSIFYVNTDIYKQKYTEIDIKAAEMKVIECTETPKGCQFLELKKYETSGYTVGKNYFFMMDENRKNDIKIYVNRDMIFANDYMDFTEEEPVNEEVVEKKETSTDNVNKEPEKTLDAFLTQSEIETIKKGETITKENLIFMLQNDNNKKMINTKEGETRYIILNLIELSKLSFGNKVVNNNVNLLLKTN